MISANIPEESIIRSYEFTLWVTPPSAKDDPEVWANAVYAAGSDDTLVGCRSGQNFIHFDREATSFDEAVKSAFRTVRDAGGRVLRLDAPEDQLSWAL